MKIDSLTIYNKNNILVEFDGWHFEGTIRKVINELLAYERRELKKEFKKWKLKGELKPYS